MIATIEPIPTLDLRKVKFYSIRKGDAIWLDFEEFWDRMSQTPENMGNMQELTKWITQLGERGAHSRYFKHERMAEALPTHYEFQHPQSVYGIRLYCVRLTDSVVFLLNGGLKTMEKAQDCPNVKTHFYQANKVAQQLTSAIKDKRIRLLNKEIIINEEDFYIEIP